MSHFIVPKLLLIVGIADGLCAIDITSKAGIVSDVANAAMIAQNAFYILDVCVKGSQHEGGIAVNIGDDEGLDVKIVPYNPSVRCSDNPTGPPLDASRQVLDLMPASNDPHIFGRSGSPGVMVSLPRTFAAGASIYQPHP